MALSVFPLAVTLTAIDRLTGPLSKIEGKLARLGVKARKAGRSMTAGLTIPALLLGGAMLKQAIGFEEAMLNLEALTEAPAEELAALEQQALDLGATTIFTARQVAAAQGIMSRAGLDTEDKLQGLPIILEFAAAGALDFAEAADFAITIMKSMGREASDLQEITGTITKAAFSANVTITTLVEAFTDAAGASNVLGVDLQEVAAVLAILGEKGFQASKGGTALRNILTRLSTGAGETGIMLKELGLTGRDFLDDNNKTIGFTASLRKLTAAGADELTLLKGFGMRAGGPMAQLLITGADAIDEFTSKIKNDLTINTRLAEVRMKGAAGAMRELAAAVEALSITIGKAFLLEFFTDTTRALTEWTREMEKTSPATLKFWTTVVLVLAVMGPMLILLGLAASGFGVMVTILTVVAGALVTLVPLVLALGLALIMTPLGLAIVGFAAFAAGAIWVSKNLDRIKKTAKAMWLSIKETTGAVFGWLVRKVRGLVDLVPDWLVNLFGGSPSRRAAAFVNTSVTSSELATGPRLGFGDPNDPSFRTTAAEARLFVDFGNVPANVRVTSDDSEVPIDLTLGYALQAVGP